ncbi:hypothetical protein U1Q18_014714, partial [Sarracenia purpurea var. burkii]
EQAPVHRLASLDPSLSDAPPQEQPAPVASQEPAAANSSEPQIQEDVSLTEPEKDPALDKSDAVTPTESSATERRHVPPVSQTFERKKRLLKDIHIDAS